MTYPINDASYYEQEMEWGNPILTGNPRVASRITEIAQLFPNNVHTILDIGCGDGGLINYLMKNYDRFNYIVAFERSKSALAHVESHKVCGSCDKIPVKDKSFDCVISCEVLEHLPVGIFDKALDELQRVSKQYILITVPNSENRMKAYIRCPYCECEFHRYRHVRSFTPKDFPNLFPSFKLLEIKLIGPVEADYPRWIISFSKKVGLLRKKVPGNPICPQCGFNHFVNSKKIPSEDKAQLFNFSVILNQIHFFWTCLLPRKIRQPWLAALYKREASEESV